MSGERRPCAHYSLLVTLCGFMLRIVEYYGRYERARGGFARLPGWARAVMVVLALPGVLLVLLSLLALGVSIAALSLLTLPAYRLLSAVTGGRASSADRASADPDDDVERRPRFVDPVSVE